MLRRGLCCFGAGAAHRELAEETLVPTAQHRHLRSLAVGCFLLASTYTAGCVHACMHVSKFDSLQSVAGVEAIGDEAFCPGCFPQRKLSHCLIPQRRKDHLPQREMRS